MVNKLAAVIWRLLACDDTITAIQLSALIPESLKQTA
jgi:hypothetical protein